MRVVIHVSPPREGSRQVEIRLDSGQGELLASHAMSGLGTPPADPELARLLPHFEADALQEGDVEALGKRLFEILIGQPAWEEIVARATAPEKVVELALFWKAADHDLHRFGWEAMHDGEQFLGAHANLSVAITRVVADADGVDAPVPTTAPARVLYVVATGLHEHDIRSGAEVVGLLRAAERRRGGIDARIVEAATIQSLAKACNRFEPDIVHFVSHGTRDEQGRGMIELRSAEGEKHDWADGEALLDAMRTDRGHPSLVVLTSCDSAADSEQTDSLAAELVRGGVPSVIGMAGKVSDAVCRLFSHEFGVALNTGESLVKAMTHGRRAGLRRQQARAADDRAWTLPSIYLAPSVPWNHAPVDVASSEALFDRYEEYGLLQEPVFCGRRELTRLFDCLLDGDDRLEVLIAYTENNERLGRTRLLHEFAGRAVRAGHVVVMIDDRGRDRTKLPRSSIELAKRMVTEIARIRQRFKLSFPRHSLLVRMLANSTGEQVVFRDGENEREWGLALSEFLSRCQGDLDPDALRQALAADLSGLIADARESDDPSIGKESRVVVILGGLGGWNTAAELLIERLLSPQGLGDDEEHIPVFASCSFESEKGGFLKTASRDTGGFDWMHFEPFGRFEGDEEMLAYRWVLLHPRTVHKYANRVYAASSDKDPVWEKVFRETIKGIPEMLEDDDFYLLARAYETSGYFVGDEDDQSVMREYRKGL